MTDPAGNDVRKETLLSVSMQPMHAVVRSYFDGSAILAVYGIYPNPGRAQSAIDVLGEMGIPDKLEIVPFYQVNQ